MKEADQRPTAIFPGRFQPLHKGHYHELERLQNNYDLRVLIGSAEKERTKKNPLSLSERKDILKACLPDVEPFGIRDVEHDGQWVAEIESKVDFDLVVTGNPWTQRCFEPTTYEIKRPQFYQPDTYSGHNIRQLIRQGEKWQHLVPGCALQKLKQFNFSQLVSDGQN